MATRQVKDCDMCGKKEIQCPTIGVLMDPPIVMDFCEGCISRAFSILLKTVSGSQVSCFLKELEKEKKNLRLGEI